MSKLPVLVLIRGLPGSGKTSLAKKMFPLHDHHAADDYFEDLGRFAPSHLGRAHRQCQRRVQASLVAGRSVCVHNTNTTVREIRSYLNICERLGINIQVLHIESGLNDRQLADRNLHGVPESTIKKMRKRWEPFPGERIVFNADLS